MEAQLFHADGQAEMTRLIVAQSLGGSSPLCALTSIKWEDIQGVWKRALQLWKLIEIYTEDIHNVLNCQNVAKHTEFYLG